MTDKLFDLADAAAICVTPYLLREQRAETLRRAQDAADAERSGGVRWSGLAGAPSSPLRTAEQIRLAAETALRRAESFARSPRGRFLAGLRGLERQGYAAPAEKARAAFGRGFADPDRPACPAEIGAAIAVLARIESPDAHGACLALADLLGAALRLAAE